MIFLLNTLIFLLFLYTLVLLARIVLDWVQLFSRSWRPTAIVLVIANVVYALTDPPLRFLGRFIPPLRLGAVAIDMGFLVLFLGVWLAQALLQGALRAIA